MRLRSLEELRHTGTIAWAADERGWMGRPDDIVAALSREGFEEYKREVTRSRRDREPRGGLWQGIDARTGTVASAVWIRREADRALVFVDLDGEPIRDEM